MKTLTKADLVREAELRLEIFNVAGRRVRAGKYYVRMVGPNFAQTKPVVVVR